MVASLENIALDFGLVQIHTKVDVVVLCATEPTAYAAASLAQANALGNAKLGANNMFGAPVAAANGRSVASGLVTTQGTVLTTGTANWWAAIDSTAGSLYAHGTLSATAVMTAAQSFSLSTFTITIPSH